MTTKPPLQKILRGKFYTEKTKTNMTMKGQEVLTLRRKTDKTDKYLQSSMELVYKLKS
jgi:hypothetical protein